MASGVAGHTRAHDDPAAFGNVPLDVALRVDRRRYVLYRRGVYGVCLVVDLGLYGPHVVVPVWQRRLTHLGQRLLGIGCYAWLRRKLRFGYASRLCRRIRHEAEPACRRRGERYRHGSVGIESDIYGGVRTVYRKGGNGGICTVDFGLEACAVGCGRGQKFKRKRAGRIWPSAVEGYGIDTARRQCYARCRVAVRDGSGIVGRKVGLDGSVGTRGILFGRGVGYRTHILEIGGGGLDFGLDVARALDLDLCRGKISHRLVWLDPRAARLAPPGRVEDTDLDVEFRGGLERRVEDLPPLVAHHKDVAFGIEPVLSDVADEGAVYAGAFHGVQVTHDTLLGYVARDPIPIYSGLYRFGRRGEVACQLLGRGAGTSYGHCRREGGCGEKSLHKYGCFKL